VGDLKLGIDAGGEEVAQSKNHPELPQKQVDAGPLIRQDRFWNSPLKVVHQLG
jgi:hypothetical protein